MRSLPGVDRVEPAADAPSRGATPSPPLRVLVVDDSALNRLQLCAILSQWGIAPDIACDGVQAAKLAWEGGYDLVFMDLNMPEMDGFEATRLIRRFEQGRPFRRPAVVLAHTGQEITEGDARLARNGLDGLLPKPCDSAQVLACLTQWCPGRFERLAPQPKGQFAATLLQPPPSAR